LKNKKGINKLALKYFIKFCNQGGKINVEIPSAKIIENAVSEKQPVISCIISSVVLADKPGVDYHFDLVTGFDEENFYLNDSIWDYRGGKKKILKEDYLYGIYSSAVGSLDNACLITISK